MIMGKILNNEIQLSTEELLLITGTVDCKLEEWAVFLENPLFDRDYYDKVKIANDKIKKSIKGNNYIN